MKKWLSAAFVVLAIVLALTGSIAETAEQSGMLHNSVRSNDSTPFEMYIDEYGVIYGCVGSPGDLIIPQVY